MTTTNKHNKKAQITAFIIVGIIIMALAGMAFYFYGDAFKKDYMPDGTLTGKEVQGFVESCLKDVATPGLYLMGHQGGKLFREEEFGPPEFQMQHLLTEERVIPYYLINGQNVMPSTEHMEQFLGQYIEENLKTCTDFSGFIKQGMLVEKGEVDATVTFTKNNVHIEALYPVTLTEKPGSPLEKTYLTRNFKADLPVRMGELLDIATYMTELAKAEPEKAHMPEFMELNEDHNVMITILPYDEEATVYSIYDPKSVIDDAPYMHWFAVKQGMGRQGNINTAPEFTNLKDFTLAVGKRFEYVLDYEDSEGDAVAFTSNHPVIRPNPEGVFNFTPTAAGRAVVTITARDSRGKQTNEKAIFVVES